MNTVMSFTAYYPTFKWYIFVMFLIKITTAKIAILRMKTLNKCK